MIISVACPAYKIDDTLNLKEVGKCIDQVLVQNFANKRIVLRAISSEEHTISQSELIKKIETLGFDRYDPDRTGDRYKNIASKKIDFFGRNCIVKEGKRLSLPLLEGFHIYGAKFHQKPSSKMDIWLVYDRDKLKVVMHQYAEQPNIKRDGYIFKNPDDKPAALLGVLRIN